MPSDPVNSVDGLRILIVTPTVPYPPNWGFGIRVYQIVRELSRRHEVSVLCHASEGDAEHVVALETVCHAVYTVPGRSLPDRAKRVAQLRSLLYRRSYQTSSVCTEAMEVAFRELQTTQQFDLIQFESSQTSELPVTGDATIILDEHNLEYELLRRMYATRTIASTETLQLG